MCLIFRKFKSLKLKKMHIDSLKVELIDWISKINNPNSLQKLLKLKEKLKIPENKIGTKIFGSGKNLIEYVADDFNEPLDVFKAYKK